ncbi:MAG: arylesterase [Saprospiraceae bacterium]|nr:arylesterase [Saprospiraceae bacterium]
MQKTLWLVLLGLLLCHCASESNPQQQATAETEKEVVQPPKEKNKRILFFGNSLTAGYQLQEEESFPARIQQKIDSLDLPFDVVNAGLSGETSAGGLGRIDWVLNQQVDVFVLELGPNDALRGLDLDQTEKNLRKILKRVQEKHPEASLIIAGLLAPPNMGREYTAQFAGIYPTLAAEFDTGLVPFLLEGVAGIPELNLNDGIHPNPTGQKIVANNVWQVLQSYLSE